MTEDQVNAIESDPLFVAVLMAQTKEEASKALKTLKSIRGNNAEKHLIEYLKLEKKP